MAPKTQLILALEWVRNTGGNGSVAALIEDFEPIGFRLWSEMKRDALAEERGGKLFLTPGGEDRLRTAAARPSFPRVVP